MMSLSSLNFRNVKYLFPLFLLSLFWSFSACTSDNEEELFEEEQCDLSSVGYSLNVKPILEQNCYSCHSSTVSNNSGGGIDLMDFDQLTAKVNEGSLLGSIKHESAYSPMPKGGSKLSDCEIETIQAWINAGAKED